MKHYRVDITGTTPLLLHADNIEWSDRMEEWKNDVSNKKTSKAGDDRSPAFRWIGSLWHHEGVVVIPTEYVMRSIMGGGAMVPTGKGQKTFKSQTQSGIMPTTYGWPLLVNGSQIPFGPIEALIEEPDFAKHKAAVAAMGFSLFLKRAKIGASKHVRVRPMFTNWAISGELVVTDTQITEQVLSTIIRCAGQYKGIGDWIPGGRTPGTFGIYSHTLTAIS